MSKYIKIEGEKRILRVRRYYEDTEWGGDVRNDINQWISN